jgi:uncharacterized tellurite resistance protein B-like protein
VASCDGMSILRLLKLNSGRERGDSEKAESIRKIMDELKMLDPARARFVSCFAYLLSRLAGADLEISPEETRIMEEMIMRQGELPESQAAMVVRLAKTQSLLFGGTEDFLVAREFRELSSLKERLALLNCLYAVAASHDSISTIEDNEISQIASELRVEHPDFISVRLKYRDHLAVLKAEE